MPLCDSILGNNRWSILSLKFLHPRLEAHYRKYNLNSVLIQSRLALLLGAMLYEIYGVLDYILVSEELIALIFAIRLSTTCSILLVFALSFSRLFRKYSEQILSVTMIAACFSLLWKMSLIDQSIFPYYFSGLLLFFFWVHAFQVFSFLYVVFTAIVILVVTVASLFLVKLSFIEIVSYTFILITIAGVSIFSAYITEKRNRSLFLSQKELDRERYIHHERAMHDVLTHLPNRFLVIDRIGRVIEETYRTPQICAGYFLDLDNFKAINDTYGHATGDAVLQEVAKRIKGCVRGMDTIGRLSGDEFFVLAQDIKSEAHALDLGIKIMNKVNAVYVVNGKALDSMMTVSIGICMFPYENATALDVINKADHAMYKAKSGNKSGIVILK